MAKLKVGEMVFDLRNYRAAAVKDDRGRVSRNIYAFINEQPGAVPSTFEQVKSLIDSAEIFQVRADTGELLAVIDGKLQEVVYELSTIQNVEAMAIMMRFE